MTISRHVFIHSFVTLLSRGCTVRESLEILADEDNDSRLSGTAEIVLEDLQKGRHLAEIFSGRSILGGKRYQPYIDMFGQTGNIHSALKLVLEDIQQVAENRTRMVQAILYPACVTGCTALFLVLLFTAGLPWIRHTGLLRSEEILSGMRKGIVLAAIFLVFSTGSAALLSAFLLGKKKAEQAFWSSLDSLGDAGLTLEQALAGCSGTIPVSFKNGFGGTIVDGAGQDLFTRSALRTLLSTGNSRETFKTIAAYKKEKLSELYSVFGKIAEPVLLAITGIVILIISLTVFLPVIAGNGGFP